MYPSETTPLRLAIIGAGYSGTLLAVHLLRQSKPAHIDLIDPRLPGRGLAYSTAWGCHLLNVPAGRMSSFASEPGHFIEWLKNNAHPDAQTDSFVPRNTFGAYIQDVYQTAIRNASPKHRLRHFATHAVRLTRSGDTAQILLHSGEQLAVDRVVLATGNPAPHSLQPNSDRYFHSPWDPGALCGLAPNANVLLLGCGLTAIDAFLALRAQGHQGLVTCLSRRGKASQVHTLYRVLPDPFLPRGITSARHLLRAIRRRVLEAQILGYDWRAVVDSLRPITNELWQGFDLTEKARVLRHLKTWWDIHRHRMAPEIGVRIEQAMRRKNLRFLAGRLRTVTPEADGLRLDIHLRNGQPDTMKVDRLISCTGSELDYRRLPDPFIRGLLDAGIAQPSAIGPGLDTDPAGAVIDAHGTPSAWFFTIGPPRFGNYFETTAVPELRGQSEALANHLVSTPFELVEPPMEDYIAAGI
jgi:uncharacterized NAD(P)/FAD-binding protein YdhS